MNTQICSVCLDGGGPDRVNLGLCESVWSTTENLTGESAENEMKHQRPFSIESY